MNGTTAEALDERACRYVATLPATDPLARANALIDEAIRFQNEGRFADANHCLEQAATLIRREVSA